MMLDDDDYKSRGLNVECAARIVYAVWLVNGRV